ncbi:hypothetical protein [Planctomycetes bacterium K23_9]|uniref:Uncharacterized protein n=1 Tax=Stieleria marina TaxID=1930275 RepID=A0A517NQS8_9BACT|nr:hypothetical protein K239x_14180 [Planctomycetes bacterium K23_9]
MKRSHSILLSVTVVAASVTRLYLLRGAAAATSAVLVAERLYDASVITQLSFDPNAIVLLAPGPDELPGQAELDDDFDGVIDNRAEMGAVGSDDVCLAPWNPGYQAAADRGDAVEISRGAFVDDGPVSVGKAAANGVSLSPGQSDHRRLLITGTTRGRTWSRMIMDHR